MDTSRSLAEQIDADLQSPPDRSLAAMRKERRRWSSRLKGAPAEDVLALAVELFERFGYRWVTYKLVVHDRSAVEAFLATHDDRLAAHVKREVRSKLTTGLKNAPSRRRSEHGPSSEHGP